MRFRPDQSRTEIAFQRVQPGTGQALKPLTKKNLRELNIEQTWQAILDHPNLVYVDDYGVRHKPVGFSVNKSSFGSFPGTAYGLGWLAYMNLGEPLIEERRNITQPPPDSFSSRTYVNRSQSEMTFTDSVDFTVSNGATWSLSGDSKLTFGGSVSAQLQLQLQNKLGLNLQGQLGTQLKNEMANKNANTVTNKNSKDSVGVDNANTVDTSVANGMTNSASTSLELTGGLHHHGQRLRHRRAQRRAGPGDRGLRRRFVDHQLGVEVADLRQGPARLPRGNHGHPAPCPQAVHLRDPGDLLRAARGEVRGAGGRPLSPAGGRPPRSRRAGRPRHR